MGGTTPMGGTSPISVDPPTAPDKCSSEAYTNVDCSPLPTEEGCATIFGFAPKTACVMGKRVLLPKVAQQFDSCMVALDTADACDVGYANNCLYEALDNACSQKTTQLYCQEVRVGCASFAQEDCERLMNGVSDVGRGKFLSCMQTTSCDTPSCITGLIR